MNISIFGAGYVGTTTAACFALKHQVTLIDIDPEKIKAIENRKPFFYEEGLDEIIQKVTANKSLRAIHIDSDVPASDLVFICVGTPSDSSGHIDLTQVRDVAKKLKQDLSKFARDGSILVMKSTVVPGTTRRYLNPIVQNKTKLGVAMNPEFLAQGSAVRDTLHPNRIVIGADKDWVFEKLKTFYWDFYAGQDIPILTMSLESTEFAKYASNALLATKISFANELANIVETVPNADIGEIMNVVGLDHRIMPKFLNAGIGFGGSCFPKDLKALIRFAEDNTGYSSPILQSVLNINKRRPLYLVKILREELGSLDDKKIAVLGLTFKPGTSDIREAPSLDIISALWRYGAEVYVHDPVLDQIDLRPFKRFDVKFCKDIYDCLDSAEACILVTEWAEYQKLDLSEMTSSMKKKLIIDGRRIFANKKMPSDVQYFTVGRRSKKT
ncbi:MAG: UDP-glucose dehydrogenase family protein [Candidatus Hermodarchaeota archaeon]